jgi:hypothetical protein
MTWTRLGGSVKSPNGKGKQTESWLSANDTQNLRWRGMLRGYSERKSAMPPPGLIDRKTATARMPQQEPQLQLQQLRLQLRLPKATQRSRRF